MPANVTPRRTPNHGRSISHPFPSIFGKNQERRHDTLSNDTDGNSNDADHAMQFLKSSNTQQSDCNDDFVTGNCATCDSTVRWPRQLDVYRCTVCLMVNDLKPATTTSSTMQINSDQKTFKQQVFEHTGSRQNRAPDQMVHKLPIGTKQAPALRAHKSIEQHVPKQKEAERGAYERQLHEQAPQNHFEVGYQGSNSSIVSDVQRKGIETLSRQSLHHQY